MDLFSVKEVLMNKNLASFTQVKNKIKDSVDLDDDVGIKEYKINKFHSSKNSVLYLDMEEEKHLSLLKIATC